MIDIEKTQELLRIEGVDGWLLYNFHNIDPCAASILRIPEGAVHTRRWFYWIPAQGEPMKLVHKIESNALNHLPGERMLYAQWKQLHEQLSKLLAGAKRACMQYSPMNAIPYVSYVDGGTVELVRSTGVEVVSSANLIQFFEAVWSPEGLESHRDAAQKIHRICQSAFALVKDRIRSGREVSEYEVQQFILSEFGRNELVCDHPPIVGVNEHSGDPHYEPCAERFSMIRRGDLLLIDLWAKGNKAQSVYADITWVGEVDDRVDERHALIFSIVRDARDAAIRLVQEAFRSGRPVQGYQVDDAARGVIEKAGYGDFFIHRTGHSIGREVHWSGANMDNFETRDERNLIEGTGFSIEPGIYLPEFGIRSEIDMCIHRGEAIVSTQPVQQELFPILATDFS